MSEGDVVWIMARRLDEALAGGRLRRAELRVPRHAGARLAGSTVREVASRGKHILLRLDSGVTLHTHPGMEGSWTIRPATDRWPPPRADVRAVLRTGESLAIGRRLARVDLVRTTAEHHLVGHLGPDPLGPDWDPDEATRRLLLRSRRPICEALTDQANLAGVGNLHRAELLFLRGLGPWTPAGAVSEPRRLVELARTVLWANCESLEQSTSGHRRKSSRLHVYGRAGEPCRRCRTRIRTDLDAERRRVWWCPRCQPGPDAPAYEHTV